MATFVLVHGAWHGSWCWDEVNPSLVGAGHRVYAPDLPGMGADPTPLATLSLADWADYIAEIVEQADEPVVLVGHSRGGIVISEVAERVPELIFRLVYLTAFLVPSGKSLGEISAAVIASTGMGEAIIPGGRGDFTIDPEKSRQLLFSACTDERASSAIRRLCPEPMFSLETPLALTQRRFGSVARAYIECEQDAALPLSAQRSMQASLPCDPVIVLPSDHSPFLSMPGRLAAALIALTPALAP